MNARRRDNTPPFEIMGSRPSSPQAPGHGPRPGGGLGAGIGGFFGSLADAWHRSASEPMTLRVPRGMALALMAGLLGLLILAYWVGHSRGGSAAEQRVTETYRGALEGDGRVPPDRPGTDSAASDASDAIPGANQAVSARRDTRVRGSNYLILAMSPQNEAKLLQTFLKEREVDVLIGPRNNKGLCQVIALRGFTPEQYRDTDENERFMTHMRGLGRKWKSANQSKGDDLSSMYYQKYEPHVGR